MRFLFISAAILALSLVACNGPEEPAPRVGPGNTLVETLEYTGVLISKDGASEFSHVFGESTEFWEPSIDDVSRAEACIRQFLTSAQDNPQLDTSQKVNAPVILENLEEYRRQYVGIVVDGEKSIWCNAFRPEDEFPNWQRLPVYVLDGGNDFWEIEYIPVKDECINFYVHGEA
jgi:hypothetical protein